MVNTLSLYSLLKNECLASLNLQERSLLLTRDETCGVTSLLRWQVASIRSNQMLDNESKLRFMS